MAASSEVLQKAQKLSAGAFKVPISRENLGLPRLGRPSSSWDCPRRRQEKVKMPVPINWNTSRHQNWSLKQWNTVNLTQFEI